MGIQLSAVTAAPSGSATVVPFPRDERLIADLNAPEQILRRVRMKARATGCTQRQVQLVEAHAKGCLGGGATPLATARSAEAFTKQLLGGAL